VRRTGEENRALQIHEVEERTGRQRDRDPVPQDRCAGRGEASCDGVDRDTRQDREDWEEEDEVLVPEVQPRRRCEQRCASEEGDEESPRARLASPEERREPESGERDGQVRGRQDRAERAPEVHHSRASGVKVAYVWRR